MIFFFSSSTRHVSDGFNLSLKSKHALRHGSIEHAKITPKGRFPENVDILLTGSNLVLSISATRDRVAVSPEELLKSVIAKHLVDYLNKNAENIGISTVSCLYIDEDTNTLQLSIAPSRVTPEGSRAFNVKLLSVSLQYNWLSASKVERDADDGSEQQKPLLNRKNSTKKDGPFSSRLLLPLETALNTVVEKFVCFHLVKRYPLIFGPWCKKLDLEATHFPSIARSVFHIMKRSLNDEFQTKAKRKVKKLKQQHITSSSAASASLSAYLDDAYDKDEEASSIAPSREDALCLAMERMFKNTVSKPRFQGSAASELIDHDDEDIQLSQYQSEMEVDDVEPPHSSLRDEDMLLMMDEVIFPAEEPRGALHRDQGHVELFDVQDDILFLDENEGDVFADEVDEDEDVFDLDDTDGENPHHDVRIQESPDSEDDLWTFDSDSFPTFSPPTSVTSSQCSNDDKPKPWDLGSSDVAVGTIGEGEKGFLFKDLDDLFDEEHEMETRRVEEGARYFDYGQQALAQSLDNGDVGMLLHEEDEVAHDFELMDDRDDHYDDDHRPGRDHNQGPSTEPCARSSPPLSMTLDDMDQMLLYDDEDNVIDEADDLYGI